MSGSKCFELKQGKNFVGRDEVCDVQIDHRLLSRKHAVIAVSNDQVAIRDLDSTNGTMVNFKRIQDACPIQVGDALTFGEFTYRLALTEKPLNETLYSRQRASSQSYSISDPGGDETALRESFPLPPGWNGSGAGDNTRSNEDVEARRLIHQTLLHIGSARGALVVIDGELKSQVFRLLGPGPVWIVGRGGDCDVQVEQNTISLRHARLSLQAGSWQIEDLKSKNGIKVKNLKVQNATLQHGIRFDLGQLRCAFVDGQKTPEPV